MKGVKSTARLKVLLQSNVTRLALAACFILGCGSHNPPTYPVTGKVVLPGDKTLQYGGEIVFISTDGPKRMRASAVFGPDGKFELSTFAPGDGAVEGNYEVAVIPTVPDELEGKISEREYDKLAEQIDARFLNPSASGLKFSVSAETSPHDFRVEVTRPKKKSRRR